MIRLKSHFIILTMMVVMALANTVALAAEVPRMTKEELKGFLDDPTVVVLDVRSGRDWKSSEFKIKGADHASPKEFGQWAQKYAKDKKLVLYCA